MCSDAGVLYVIGNLIQQASSRSLDVLSLHHGYLVQWHWGPEKKLQGKALNSITGLLWQLMVSETGRPLLGTLRIGAITDYYSSSYKCVELTSSKRCCQGGGEGGGGTQHYSSTSGMHYPNRTRSFSNSSLTMIVMAGAKFLKKNNAKK